MTEKEQASLLALLASVGYTSFCSGQEFIGLDGLPIPFAGTSVLREHGGLFSIRNPARRYIDLDLSYDPRARCPMQETTLQNIAISAPAYYLRDPEAGTGVSQDLMHVFQGFCDLYTPVFGHSSSEGWDEISHCREFVQADVCEGRTPSVLSWLNYFDRVLIEDGLKVLHELGASVGPLAQGQRVQFFESPMQVSFLRLQEINSVWTCRHAFP